MKKKESELTNHKAEKPVRVMIQRTRSVQYQTMQVCVCVSAGKGMSKRKEKERGGGRILERKREEEVKQYENSIVVWY